MKTNELTGAALDWAAIYAQCITVTEGKPIQARDLANAALKNGMASPSTDWAQGGPIIEREWISVEKRDNELHWTAVLRYADGNRLYGFADTPLIAAMRCYVASKLGDDVAIPEELL